jgi:acetoin utilization deacetylase AcuC-like enzyme
MTSKLAYIDVDAHMPDGIWKEVEKLRSLDRERRCAILGENHSALTGLLFASVHLPGYPFPETCHSSRCVMPKTSRRAFELRVNKQLLPKGMNNKGSATNGQVLASYARWQQQLDADMPRFQPDGIFVGLGFDLHQDEVEIGDKRMGLGIRAKHYRRLLAGLPPTPGPVVLTLEGGYSKAGVEDGIFGALAGMVKFSLKNGQKRGRWAKGELATKRMHFNVSIAAHSCAQPSKRRRSSLMT